MEVLARFAGFLALTIAVAAAVAFYGIWGWAAGMFFLAVVGVWVVFGVTDEWASQVFGVFMVFIAVFCLGVWGGRNIERLERLPRKISALVLQ